MVSLVYNRGASFRRSEDRYREMRAIHQHMVHERFDQVPSAIRGMQRLWENLPNMRGLVDRRELEARLFERGLKG
jgi:GH24 family phage-related lysozyme (muramidase)